MNESYIAFKVVNDLLQDLRVERAKLVEERETTSCYTIQLELLDARIEAVRETLKLL